MPDLDRVINHTTIYLDRSVGSGTWFLCGEALARFVCSGTMAGTDTIDFGVVGSNYQHMFDRCEMFGLTPVQLLDDSFKVPFGDTWVRISVFSQAKKGRLYNGAMGWNIRPEWVICPDPEEFKKKHPEMSAFGVWRRQLSEDTHLAVNLPYEYGTILDVTVPEWHRMAPKRLRPSSGDVFYTPERAGNAKKLIAALYDQADTCGFADRLFIGFGTCLGYLMYGTFIPKDRDIDMCILSDGLDPAAIKRYAELCRRIEGRSKGNPKADPYRFECAERNDTGAATWFSVGYLDPNTEEGTKSCNWFFFEWNGWMWHSKGRRWVDPGKINHERVQFSKEDEAVALGLPAERIPSLTTIDFDGTKVLAPERPGACCDWWYPGWSPTGKGASAHRSVLVIPKWENKESWRMA